MLYGDKARGLIDNPLNETSIQMLKSRLSTVTLDGEKIPFHDPHCQPYTYLGVEITMTLNWALQKKKVLQGLRAKCEQVLNSFTSPAQTLKYFQNSIRPYVTYAFPLGMYTPHDIQELNSILARFAKRALHLPLYTPNALILEKVEHMGVGATSLMVDYVQNVTAYLTRALNDEGPLGTFARGTLKQQLEFLGGMRTLEIHTVDRNLLKLTQHFHLANQRSLLRSANLDIEFPPTFHVDTQATRLQQMLAEMRYDPLQLGESLAINLDINLCLKELGITDLGELLCRGRKNRQRVINTSELRRKIGSTVKKRHMVALNQLTLLLNKHPAHEDIKAYKCSANLPPQDREIHSDFGIDQTHPIPDDRDQKTLQACLKDNNPINLSPRSKIGLDLGQRNRKRSRNDERPDVLSNETIFQAYILYKEKQPTIPDPEPVKDDSSTEQVRNTRPRLELNPVAPENSVPAPLVQQGDDPVEDAQPGQELPQLNPYCSAPLAGSPPTLDLQADTDMGPSPEPAAKHAQKQSQPPRQPPKRQTLSKKMRAQKREEGKRKKSGLEIPPGLKSFEELQDWVANYSQDWHLVQTLYNNQERVESVLSKRLRRGEQMYEVQWADTYIRKVHKALYLEKTEKYRPKKVSELDPIEHAGEIKKWGITEPDLWEKVSWETCYEEAVGIDRDPGVQYMIAEMTEALKADKAIYRRTPKERLPPRQHGPAGHLGLPGIPLSPPPPPGPGTGRLHPHRPTQQHQSRPRH